MIHSDEFIMNLYHGRIISKLLDKVCILLHNSQKKRFVFYYIMCLDALN